MPIVVKSGANPGFSALGGFAGGRARRQQQDAAVAQSSIAQGKARRAANKRHLASLESQRIEAQKSRSFVREQAERDQEDRIADQDRRQSIRQQDITYEITARKEAEFNRIAEALEMMRESGNYSEEDMAKFEIEADRKRMGLGRAQPRIKKPPVGPTIKEKTDAIKAAQGMATGLDDKLDKKQMAEYYKVITGEDLPGYGPDDSISPEDAMRVQRLEELAAEAAEGDEPDYVQQRMLRRKRDDIIGGRTMRTESPRETSGDEEGFQFPTKHPIVKNPDGSRSNLKLASFGFTDASGKERHYAIPTMVGGEQLTDKEAVAVAKSHGLDKYPSYETVKEVEAWIGKEHGKFAPPETEAEVPQESRAERVKREREVRKHSVEAGRKARAESVEAGRTSRSTSRSQSRRSRRQDRKDKAGGAGKRGGREEASGMNALFNMSKKEQAELIKQIADERGMTPDEVWLKLGNSASRSR